MEMCKRCERQANNGWRYCNNCAQAIAERAYQDEIDLSKTDGKLLKEANAYLREIELSRQELDKGPADETERDAKNAIRTHNRREALPIDRPKKNNKMWK